LLHFIPLFYHFVIIIQDKKYKKRRKISLSIGIFDNFAIA
jgi:hypothetical protein